ncbi:nuclear transport factor 2 family protein [Bordetella genomosp. 13]|uniref:nuclear transport factor 2 family protein n=1 Tax=Bordetella genomosp. 13 TaxID=463040 RepID=UPI0011A7A74E|nr:nuclear transport factor 2 family protein [Bordetella genomosp. 13]
MSLSLPTAVRVYFDISNGSDSSAIGQCFGPDAVVLDEGRTHRGHAAIQAWKRQAREKFQYTVEPVSAYQQGDRLAVTANVAGSFPGSPVRLDHVFELAGGRIRSLEIG